MLTVGAAGCGCDVPAHFYSWSWSLNGDWSRPFVGQEEILQCTVRGNNADARYSQRGPTMELE